MQSSSSAATAHYSPRKRKTAPGANEVKPRRSEGEFAELQTTLTHINDLPEELLGQVIRELGPEERVFAELVCRRWGRVSRAYGWLNYSLIANKQYEWEEAYLAEHEGKIAESWLRRITRSLLALIGVDQTPISDLEKQLKCLLSRCAPTVREIDLSGMNGYGVDKRVCALLTGEMKMLETLVLDGIRLDSSQLVTIGTRLPWLKEISLERCLSEDSKSVESALATMLSLCRRLSILRLSGNLALTGELFISKLPATLYFLNLHECPKLHHSAVESLLATCGGKLSALFLGTGPVSGAWDGWTSAHFERLFNGLCRLETLCLSEFPSTNGDGDGAERSMDEREARYRAVGALTNLRTLTLRCNECVTDEVMDQVVAGCECLEDLELIGCNDAPISTKAIIRLAQLPKLTTLELHQHQSIDDDTLAKLAKGPARLRTLSVSGCEKVTDKGVSSLLDGCGGELRELDISHCPLVTQATVAKLQALYDGASSSNSAEERRVFMLKADLEHLGFERKEFKADQ